MSDFHPQSAFGLPSFIGVSASGNSSGLEPYDTGHLYHEHNYLALPHPLQIPPDNGYADDGSTYMSHSSAVSLPGLQYTSPTMAGHTISQQYENDASILDDLSSFSPITPNYNIQAYRTPYPDSTTTSTSSATSPDPIIAVENDEDKRKRNQAASARFRQKKKQREHQLVETTREMQERTRKLEAENDGLKKENIFLKKLLVEKVDHMNEDDREMLRKVTSDALNRK